MPCGCLQFKTSDSFVMTLDKKKLTKDDQGEHRIQINLRDEYYRKSFQQNIYAFKLIIEFEEAPEE